MPKEVAHRYINDVLSINNPDFENYRGQMSLRSNTQRKTTLLLSTQICSCKKVGMVKFAFPFTTSETISISKLQTFRSLVATFRLCPAMALYLINCPIHQGLFLLWMFYFEGGAIFQQASRAGICQGTFEIVIGSSMVGTGILWNNMRSPFS